MVSGTRNHASIPVCMLSQSPKLTADNFFRRKYNTASKLERFIDHKFDDADTQQLTCGR